MQDNSLYDELVVNFVQTEIKCLPLCDSLSLKRGKNGLKTFLLCEGGGPLAVEDFSNDEDEKNPPVANATSPLAEGGQEAPQNDDDNQHITYKHINLKK